MKYLIVVYVVSTVFCTATCYVISSTKDVEITTVSQKNYSPDVTEEIYVNRKGSKGMMLDDKKIYLDDVIYALTHQNWTEDEVPCLNQTLQLIYNLQNSTLWAVWDWDSTSSEPEGILFGTRYHLGNFDECMSAPWYQTHPDLRTQYCLAEIVLERIDKKALKKQKDNFNPYASAVDYLESSSKFQRSRNILTWGACVPASCSTASVVRLLETLLARSYVGAAGLRGKITINEECQKADHPREYSGTFYGFVGTMASLLAIAIICTYLNNLNKNNLETSLGKEIIKAFCLKDNFKDLYKVQSDGVEVLYGVRFLSMCVVVLGHQCGLVNGGPVTNGFNIDKDAVSTLGMLILHDDLVVDSFFYLSGFLAAKGVVTMRRLPNLFVLFLKRYVRIVAAYAATIFFIVGVFPYIGSGPLWNRAVDVETASCKKNWWLSLLMLNNYVNSENICLIVSWYIPCDFHFFVITILLYWLYKKLPGFGAVCVTIVTVASIVVPGVINYIYKLPPIQLFSYEFLANPREQTQFQIAYIKSHNRYASYIIGFLCGYYFTTRSMSGSFGRISRSWSTFGAYISVVVMLLTMMSGPALLWSGYGLIVDTLYATLNKPVWTISLAVLVFCCSLGKVPIVKSFLSWYPWVPLSRLSYGLYLTHAVIIIRNIQVVRKPHHVDYLILLNSSAGVIFWGCLASLGIWLVVEAPINNLLLLWLKPRTKQMKTDENVNGADGFRSSAATANKGYLSDNLPNDNIYYSSKI